MSLSYAAQLTEEGVTVVPFRDPESFSALRRTFEEALYESPEFLKHPKINEVTKDYEPDRVARYGVGGTSFLGHPSVFHHPKLRRLRRIVFRELIIQVFRDYVAPDQGIELLLDRIMVRPAGDVPMKESWHRDVSPWAQPGDQILGGWLNLDETSQYFSAVPRSFLRGSAKGFVSEEAPKGGGTTYEIPPGSMVLFREDILHEVVARKQKHTSIRIFHAFRISSRLGTSTLGPSLEEVRHTLADQSVLLIKSGQLPPAYPQSAIRFPLQAQRLRLWVEEMVRPGAIDPKTRSFRSLGEMGLKHPEWKKNEVASLFVSRVHVLPDVNGKVYKTPL